MGEKETSSLDEKSKTEKAISSLDALSSDQEEISKSYMGHMRNIYSEDEECLESDGNTTSFHRTNSKKSFSTKKTLDQSLSVTDVQMATSSLERIQRMKRRNSCEASPKTTVTTQSVSSLETVKSLTDESEISS